MARAYLRLVAAISSLVLAVVLGEVVFRLIDGYSLGHLRLSRPVPPLAAAPADADQLARRYALDVAVGPKVSASWYEQDPPSIASNATPSWVRDRLELEGTESRLFEFNLAFLKDRLCRDLSTSMFGTLDDFLYFDPVEPSIYPSYRHLRRLSAPGWFTTNSFGWRGPDLALNKPANTIRIAFVGASTTVGAYAFPFSYPEFINHWLNQWSRANGWPYRFEVINAARTGIDSHSIAAIVRNELVPMEPDLVVYYEGSNQFWPPGSIGYRLGRLYSRPSSAAASRTPRQSASALGLRVQRLIDSWRGGDGSEPVKPVQWIRMPGVNEEDPDPADENLPVELPAIVKDLESVRAALEPVRSELVVTSFVWMVKDGLRLELPRQLRLFDYLNRDYWPATYKTMRRLADLQNRVFRNFARRHHLPFIDLAARFPADSNLFDDAIHVRYSSSRLQAWIVFQDLARLVTERVAAGTLPHPMIHPRSQHPAFDQPSPRHVTRASILASCAR